MMKIVAIAAIVAIASAADTYVPRSQACISQYGVTEAWCTGVCNNVAVAGTAEACPGAYDLGCCIREGADAATVIDDDSIFYPIANSEHLCEGRYTQQWCTAHCNMPDITCPSEGDGFCCSNDVSGGTELIGHTANTGTVQAATSHFCLPTTGFLGNLCPLVMDIAW